MIVEVPVIEKRGTYVFLYLLVLRIGERGEE